MFNRKKIEKLERENRYLAEKIQLSASNPVKVIGGNPYTDYGEGVTAIYEKYQGLAEWGSLFTGIIVEFRAAMIAGGGIDLAVQKSTTSGDAEAELTFLREFFDLGGFYGNNLATHTVFSELEGKLCYTLTWDKTHTWRDSNGKEQIGMVKPRFVLFGNKKYKIQYNEDEPERATGISWTKGNEVSLKENEFVFKATGAMLLDPNIAPPKIHRVLYLLERLDKALRDWRQIDELFAAPTPFFRLPDGTPKEVASEMMSALSEKKWTIGASIALACDYQLVGADVAGAENISKEITKRAQTISGITGVPPHFLGMPELMSNRATAESLTELVQATTFREGSLWKAAIKELAVKAIRMYNTKAPVRLLAEDKVDVVMKAFSSDEIKNLINIWLPLYKSGALSKRFLLTKTPGVDVEDELQRQKEESEEILPDILK